MTSQNSRWLQTLVVFAATAMLSLLLILIPSSSEALTLTDDITALKRDVSARETQALLLKAQKASLDAEIRSTIADYEEVYGELNQIQDQIEQNRDRLATVEQDQRYYQGLMNKRVREMYKTGEISVIDILLSAENMQDLLTRVEYVRSVSKNDAVIVREVKAMRAELIDKEFQLKNDESREKVLLAEIDGKRSSIESLFKNYDELIQELDKEVGSLNVQIQTKQEQLELEARRAEISRLVAEGKMSYPIDIIFPVSGPYSYVDTWNYPRSGGRRHKGTDIFAASGTPLVACLNGVVLRVNTTDTGLGGLAITIRGDDGNNYYYAHLKEIADGIEIGNEVKKGQFIGSVGTSGNAKTTPPHLHFGVYPSGGAPVNPYPYLLQAEQRS